MPRFYFHLHQEGLCLEDPDGSELADAQAARQEALEAGRQLWAEAMITGADLSNDSFEIVSEAGETLRVPLTDALPERLRRRIDAH